MDKLASLIELISLHPFEAFVVGAAGVFALSIFVIFGVTHARCVWNMPMMRLPPPKDRQDNDRSSA
jgi:hypothetical protein